MDLTVPTVPIPPPSLEELRSFDRMERDPTFRWSMRVYTRLMQRFDASDENVYRVTKTR